MFERTALIGLLALTLLALSACESNRQYVLQRLDVGDNRSILILADVAGEISTGIYYQVKVGEEMVVSTCRICGAAKDLDLLNFKILSAAGGTLVALYEETDPERILALHDVSRGRSWPRGAPSEWSSDIDNRGEELLKQLRQEYPNSNLRLSGGGACGIRMPKHQ